MAATRRHRIANGVHVGALQADLAAGPLAAGLRGGLAAEHQDQILPHGHEGLPQREVEAVAIGIEDDEAGYAPRQADGRQDAALPVEAQRLGRFAEDAI